MLTVEMKISFYPIPELDTGGERRLMFRPGFTWGFDIPGWFISVFSALFSSVSHRYSRSGMWDLGLFSCRVGIFLLRVGYS